MFCVTKDHFVSQSLTRSPDISAPASSAYIRGHICQHILELHANAVSNLYHSSSLLRFLLSFDYRATLL